MINVGLLGARGYVGEELLGLLLKIPDYRIAFVGSRQLAGQPVFTEKHLPDLTYSDLEPETLKQADEVDVWVIAQANGVAAEFAQIIESTSPSDRVRKIIDVSSDHRFDSGWVYGLPERNQSEIRSANRIANPGCYATAAQLALLPILDQIQQPPVLFGVSGFSGAGKTPNDRNNPERLAENLLPYSLTTHIHQKEVSTQLGQPVQLIPHVAPFFRGISMTVTVQLNEALPVETLRDMYRHYYRESHWVQITDEIPEIQQVANTNHCRIGGFSTAEEDPSRLVLVSTLDNLRKGAATQVVQNMNLMFGKATHTGLE